MINGKEESGNIKQTNMTYNNYNKTLAMCKNIDNKASVTIGINNPTSLRKSRIRSYNDKYKFTKVRRGLNTSNIGPAPSTLRIQNLRKLATTSLEARQMLNYINTINKINMVQKRSNSSSTHSYSNNYPDTSSFIKDNGSENMLEDNKNKSSYDFNLFLFTNLINILEIINLNLLIKITRCYIINRIKL